MELVIATHNLKKAGEMITILGARFPGAKLLTLQDFSGSPEPDETGDTYAANAIIKAEAAAAYTGALCIADDAGLEVEAMGNEPGIYSRRFAGEETPFSEKMQIILLRLEGVPDSLRTARFRCAVAIALPGHPTQVFESTCEGIIAAEPSGNGGFGYDPIFFLPELGVTMADLTAEQKHAISHRGKVLKMVSDYLAETFATTSR